MKTGYITSNSPSNNHNVETPKLDRADFAARAAQSAFGGNYVPAAEADFCDRAPGEIAILRALRWSETSR